MRKKDENLSLAQIADQFALSQRESEFISLRLKGYTMESCAKEMACGIATVYRIASKPRVKQVTAIMMSVALSTTAQDLGGLMQKAMQTWNAILDDDLSPAPMKLMASDQIARHYDKYMESVREGLLFDAFMESQQPKPAEPLNLTFK